MQREQMECDILIVGAGPSGLSAAIRLKQLNPDLTVFVIEKAAQIGGQVLSGAAIDPRALNELIPNWAELGAPLDTPAKEDQFLFLTRKKAWRFPTPPQMQNHGNFIVSLDHLCRWLAKHAESIGVQIFTGFAGAEMIYDAQGRVCGVTTGDMGLDKDGKPSPRFQPGVELFAKQTLLAEGCRGSLTKRVVQRFSLYEKGQYQTYGIGVKELWEVSDQQHKPGTIVHSFGWPLSSDTYGGSFIYHWGINLVSVGFIVGLDYSNPYLDPYEELQRFKMHPYIRRTFEDGKRISYGARALSEGGWQSIPAKLTFPGGMLVGDCAGFLNVPKIKGTHNVMKSGMIAAEIIAKNIPFNEYGVELSEYTQAVKTSWVGEELYRARNIRPAFKKGLYVGLLNAAIDTFLFRGKAPWTFRYPEPDYATLKKAADVKKINYPKHDGKITFDKRDSLYLSNIRYHEDQPCHLILKDPNLAIDVNYKLYASPERFYCPAEVYEVLFRDHQPYLQINAGNCVHCKTCDIKDPRQNINWVPPEGGEGPDYIDM